MPHSLRVRLRKIHEKGLDHYLLTGKDDHYLLTSKDVDRLINALDVVDGLEDAIAEMEKLHHLYKVMFQGHSMSVAQECIDIIRKHTGVK